MRAGGRTFRVETSQAVRSAPQRTLPSVASFVHCVTRGTMKMRIWLCTGLISLILLSVVTALSGADYIRANGTLPPDAMQTSHANSTNTSLRAVAHHEQQTGAAPGSQRSPLPHRSPLPNGRMEEYGNDTVQERKVLALLILTLRDGRGAR